MRELSGLTMAALTQPRQQVLDELARLRQREPQRAGEVERHGNRLNVIVDEL